jgi:DNA-binding HxlR family transcriptional regulator
MKLEKLTDKGEGAARRRYDDACAAAHAMDIFGERWAVPVMRELMFGPLRFGELRAALPGISANVLTQRLEGLEAAGVVARRRLPPPASVQVYELTAWGYEAGPIFQAMGRWAARSPTHDPGRPFSPASLMLSLRTMADPARTADFDARIGFRLGEAEYLLTLDRGTVTPRRAPVEGADLVLTGDAATLAAAVYGGAPLDVLEAAGRLGIEGDRALARRFVALFPLPTKASQDVAGAGARL